MRNERELLVDCLERLNRIGISYMLVGSMASNYWGIPRSTHDLLHKLYWHKMSPSERQLLDAAGVVSVQTGALDSTYLKRWAGVLGVEPELDDILSGKVKPKSS